MDGVTVGVHLEQVFALAAGESFNFLGGPHASKLGSERAIYRNENWPADLVEKFKPYTLPSPDELAGLRIALHPSVSLVGSQFPIVSIWEVHRTAQLAPIREWVPESALVARPSLDVEVWRLPAGGYVFLGSLSQGMAMAAAAECAAAATGEFDVAENLAVLLRANVVIALQ